jgi:quinol monooxygenase YgiN
MWGAPRRSFAQMIPSKVAAVKVVTSLLTPAPEKREEFLQTLRSLRLEIEREPGCRLCVVCGDVDGGNHFVLISEWRDHAALTAHMDSDHFRILAGASRLLGASAEFRFVTSDTPFDASFAP